MKILCLSTLLFCIVLLVETSAEVKTAGIFGSNMVLQEGIENPVWGWAEPGEKITVDFVHKTIKTKADNKGKWFIKLPKMAYGGPYKMTITGINSIVYSNIMVGEVWVCSGQSNMEWPLSRSNNSKEEMDRADYPELRMFTVTKHISQFPEDDVKGGEWEVCSPATAGKFSAVGYFFARNLMNDLKVSVGMIHTSWGGTVAETWISPESIDQIPDFKDALKQLQSKDLTTYQKEKEAKLTELFGGFIPDKDIGLVNGNAVFADQHLNDATWQSIRTPSLWEDEGYAEVDGVCWYRKNFTLSKEQAAHNASLHLAKVDDTDMTWVNGVKVGETNIYNKDRVYLIKSGILKEGENTIALRVFDSGGGGGIYGPEDNLCLKTEKESIPLAGDWKIKFTQIYPPPSFLSPNAFPTLLYNAMLHPIIPYGIKGAIWYQGESNAGRAIQYRNLFKSLITDWRKQWRQGDFPFIWVQLANFMTPVAVPSESDWATLREAQTMALELPNTGMAVAIDIGEADDIHPRNKQDVGKRLALNALKIAYDKDVINSGPMFESIEIKGNKALIHFKHVAGGLTLNGDSDFVESFAIAGSDKKFYWAKGEILDENTVVLSADEVNKPIAVRFGWANNPDKLNLFNKAGLPAVPFRTDDW